VEKGILEVAGLLAVVGEGLRSNWETAKKQQISHPLKNRGFGMTTFEFGLKYCQVKRSWISC
jgi:hypothetical protein